MTWPSSTAVLPTRRTELVMDGAHTSSGSTRGTLWRFGGVGLLNTALGLGVILLARGPFGMPEAAANATGYGLGLLLSFALNRNWTFRHSGAKRTAGWRFLLLVMVAWLVNLGCVLLLIRWGARAEWAHVAGIAPYSAITYLGCRVWVFRTIR